MTRIAIQHHHSQRTILIRRRHRPIPPVHALRFRNALYPHTPSLKPNPWLHPLLAALVIAGVLVIVKILSYLPL